MLARRVLGEVAARLREELVGQRDPLVVDHADLGQVRHVRRAVRRRGGDDGGNHALETQSDVGQRDGVSHEPSRDIGVAGTGPWRLVVELLDGHVAGDEVQRHEPLEQPAVGAVGFDDVGEERVAELLGPRAGLRRSRVVRRSHGLSACIDRNVEHIGRR